MLVVIYHFSPRVLSGGFIGVDIFFVLSGFLIANLIIVEHQSRGHISLRRFWDRRFRRLLPASLVTVFVVVAFARLFAPDISRWTLRSNAIATLAYGANWWEIASRTSYESQFGAASPLQHFWSLAVEEQYYVIFPVVCLAIVALIKRSNRYPNHATASEAFVRRLLWFSLICGVLSATLMVTVFRSGSDPSRVYFGTDTRVQAILCGVVVACIHARGTLRRHTTAMTAPTEPSSRVVSTAPGVVCLLVLLAVAWKSRFTDEWLYRGGLTLVAVASALVIFSVVRNSDSRVAQFLSLSPLRFLGSISYPLYLWHWPVVTLITPNRLGRGGFLLFAVRALLSLTLALISTHLVEKPFRRAHSPSPRPVLWLPVVGMTMLVVVAASPWSLRPGKATNLPTSLKSIVDDKRPYEVNGVAQRPLRVLFLGDSVLWTLGGGRVSFPQPSTYQSPFPPRQIALWNRGTYQCSLVGGDWRLNAVVTKQEGSCPVKQKWSQAISRFHPDLVVVSAFLRDSYQHRIHGEWYGPNDAPFAEVVEFRLKEVLREVTKSDAELVILLQEPLGAAYTKGLADGIPENFAQLTKVWSDFARVHPEVGTIDLPSVICGKSRCLEPPSSSPLFRSDGVHYPPAAISEYAPRVMTALFEEYRRLRP